MNPEVTGFFDKGTNTITYVIKDPAGNKCAILDSVLDYDMEAARTSSDSADRVIAHVKEQGLEVEWLLETHVHADHLSAAPYIKKQLGGKIAIGDHIVEVQDTWKRIFHLVHGFEPDGSQFGHLFQDGETFRIGGLEMRVMYTPGHTPACVTYLSGDAAFVGDTLFMPDFGTARADFPGGDARQLYASARKILALPPETRLFMCHDYLSGARQEHEWETTVAEERAHNIHVRDGVTEEEFVAHRTERDTQLKVPSLLLPSIQVNMRAGDLPPAEENGVSYLKIPLNTV